MTATALPAESIDDRIARLKAELASLELQKLDDDMGEAAGAFLGVSHEAGDPSEIRAAIDFVRDAWKRFELWRVAHRSESAEVAAVRPVLALSPVAKVVDGRSLSPGKLASRKAIDAAISASRGQTDKRRPIVVAHRCSRCHAMGHNARSCRDRSDNEPPDEEVQADDLEPAAAITLAPAPVPVPPRDPEALARRDRLVTEGLEMAKKIAANHTRRSSTRVGMADDIHSAALEATGRRACVKK